MLIYFYMNFDAVKSFVDTLVALYLSLILVFSALAFTEIFGIRILRKFSAFTALGKLFKVFVHFWNLLKKLFSLEKKWIALLILLIIL